MCEVFTYVQGFYTIKVFFIVVACLFKESLVESPVDSSGLGILFLA